MNNSNFQQHNRNYKLRASPSDNASDEVLTQACRRTTPKHNVSGPIYRMDIGMKIVRYEVNLSEIPALNEVPCNVACRLAKHRTMNVMPRQTWHHCTIYHVCTHQHKAHSTITNSHSQQPEMPGYCSVVQRMYFAFNALTLLLGRQEEHPACKN